ncbi:LOW QUALITY PROTEIN: hypothetical protein V2J09_017713 [Rumex salicifolius]
MKTEVSQPWLLMGDFNETLSMEERTRDSDSKHRRCDRFRSWANDMAFIDLGFSGPQFTWSRDHALILMNSSGSNPAAWMMHDEFQKFVAKHWEAGTNLLSALSNLEVHLNAWNSDVFGNLFRQGIRRNLCSVVSRGLMNLEKQLREELDVVQDQIYTFWKARTDVLRNGDCNTKFFHACVVVRQKRNKIEGLYHSKGDWFEDPKDLQNMAASHFVDLFTTDESLVGPIDLPRGQFPTLNEHNFEGLSWGYEVEEIKAAVDGIGSLKAPGLDGFHAIFYQVNWSIVHKEVEDMVLNILNGGDIPPRFNEILIVLLGKVDFPESINQLCPISLRNVAFIVVMKVLVHRLKPLLRKVATPTQSSFVSQRQITNK